MSIYKLVYGIPDVDSEAVVNKRIAVELECSDEGLYKIENIFEDIEFFSEDGFLVLKRRVSEGLVYGFGDKVGALNKRGKRYTFWNTDNYTHHPGTDPLYKSFPFYIFIDSNGIKHGVFTDYPGYLEIDLDSEGNGEFTFKIKGRGFVQYVITGKSIKEIVSSYVKLTGKNTAFPIWAFGYQQSRWSYFSQKEVLEIAKKFRSRQIPCDVIWLDIDYMDSYKVFTWNPKTFSSPEKMVGKLHKMGFKISAIIDPGVKVEKGYEVFESGKNKYFLKDNSGKDFEGAVWPGRVRFPDFRERKVRKWWGRYVNEFSKIGIDGFWNDMNEISVFATEKELEEIRNLFKNSTLEEGVNLAIKAGTVGEIGRRGRGEDIVHLDGEPHYKVRNVYGFNMNRAAFEGIKSNKRKFLITRSAYSGIQRYGGVWTGDNHSWWEHIFLEMIRLSSLSLSGVFYSGCDVGGFGGDVNAELLIRFMQFGSFIPMFRNHSAIGTRNQEPWAFGKKYEDILKKVIQNRYTLIPYIYTEYMRGILKNVPLLVPLFYHFEKDKLTYNIEDEFMLGSSLLIAPVYRPGQYYRVVYLPKRALELNNNKFFSKGWHCIDAPLEIIPYFQIDGTIVPRWKAMNYLFEKEPEFVNATVVAYSGKAAGYFYEDDGITKEYKKGKYNLYKIFYKDGDIYVKALKEAIPHKSRRWIFKVFTKNNVETLEKII
ncbi:DUF5110 domain-containing protein [Thermosipho ferrireducens]|uniref:DUF5110 domain-containing protein n=1 Tax=Thermosipho ferrireducens TaxID=2571116 RepID=A0ABX7S7R3_9BACT|nr:TIM-barrel domain-containing protein [Thermosipho ferrireducens]QTA37667.1 DUF5110 domain-containing protein [Thermosipho ferrireducens]